MVRHHSIDLRAVVLLVLLLLSWSGPSTATEDELMRRRITTESSHGGVTREQILDSRNRRKKHLNVMLMDMKQKLADHSSGEKSLTDEEKSQLESNVILFRKKIESMEVDLEEWEIERMIARETETANRRLERSRDSRRITNNKHDEL